MTAVAPMTSPVGFSAMPKIVECCTTTVPAGLMEVTLKGIALPRIGMKTVSCKVTGQLSSFLFTNSSNLGSGRIGTEVGASVTLLAGSSFALDTVTFSLRLTPAFLLIRPSIRMISCPLSP